jgi:glutathione synthase/RimK-type ligase-like ATP-grasp enzyme
MTILFVDGINDQNLAMVRGLDARGHFSWTLDGCCNVRKFLRLGPEQAASITMFGPDTKQSEVSFRRKPSLVFNQIADVDTHTCALSRCAAMCRQLDVPVINHPDKLAHTSRDRVSELLQGIQGIHVPRTVRVQPCNPDDVWRLADTAGLRFPVIVRLAGYHNGLHMHLLKNREDLQALHAMPFDGRDFYLTEFVDCRDEHGFYMKSRIVFVEGKPLFRSSYFSSQWNVHHPVSVDYTDDLPGYYQYDNLTETGWARLCMAENALRELARRMELEYFGMDCYLGETGEVLLFEANASMNPLVSFGEADGRNASVVIDAIRQMVAGKSGMQVT